ncbi:MAG TPA: class I SAM-dependent methyltransferase [Candidatus Atribacteria bacterium]|nr:class I SAM-dependent methyltransferase [Candidatus Atribacteria bacterium]
MSRRSKQDKLKKSPLKKIIVSKLFLSPISYSIFNYLFDYEKVFIKWFFYKLYNPIAVEISNRIQGASLIDVGCGEGFLLFEICKRNKEIQLTGVDISRSMIKKARKRAKKLGYKNVNFFVNKPDKIPFEDNIFSHAVSTFSFHLWSEPVLMLNEIYRVLKSNGEFVIYDFNGDDKYEEENLSYIESCVKQAPLFIKRIVIEDARWDYTMFGIYDIDEVEEIIKKSLFKTVNIRVKGICGSGDNFLVEARLRK